MNCELKDSAKVRLFRAMVVTPHSPKVFLPWKTIFPPLEIYFSKAGKFLETALSVLFLKKVHSWEGVTETVLGLFLLFL